MLASFQKQAAYTFDKLNCQKYFGKLDLTTAYMHKAYIRPDMHSWHVREDRGNRCVNILIDLCHIIAKIYNNYVLQLQTLISLAKSSKVLFYLNMSDLRCYVWQVQTMKGCYSPTTIAEG